MTRIALLLSALVVAGAAVARADVPRALGYQGRLLKADGSAATGQATVTFAIYGDAEGGTALWSEQQKLALADGFYSTFLGAVSPLPAELFDGSDRFLELSLDNTPLVPRQRLATVPYALRASHAESLKGGAVDATSLAVNGTAVVDASGHLAGPARYLSGDGIQIDQASRKVSLLSTCDANQILKWNGTAWACADDSGASYTAGNGLSLSGNAFSLTTGCAAGQLLKWSGSSWACAADDNTAIAAGPGLEKSGTTLSLKSGCDANQLLKWDGSAWACAADSDTTYKAGSGLSLSGTTLSLQKNCAPGELLAFDGTAWVCSPDADTRYQAGSGLALSGTTLSLLKSCGSGQLLKWNGTAWACADDGGASYTAGSGLALSGNAFSLTNGCAAGQILKYDGSGWACAGDDNTAVAAGAGLEKSGATLSLVKSCKANELLKWDGASWACAADSDTTYKAGSGLALSGTTLSLQKNCDPGELLAFDGASWVCSPDADTRYQAGSGLALAGTTFSLTRACSTGQLLKWNGSAWGCAADDNANWVAGSGLSITGNTVGLVTGCSANQVLKWSGTAWACANDQTGTNAFAAGAGLELAGSTFQLKTSCATGQLLKWNGSDWACAADAQATVTAGAGITIDQNQVSANFATGTDAGSANTVARGDHTHDARYYTKAEVDQATSAFFTRKYTVILGLRSDTYCPQGWTNEPLPNLINANSQMWINFQGGGSVMFGGNYNNWGGGTTYQRISASSGITRICWKEFTTRGRAHTALLTFNAPSPSASLCPSGWTFLPSTETRANDNRTMFIAHEGGAFIGGIDTDAYSMSNSSTRSGQQYRWWAGTANMACFKVMGVEEDPATRYGVYPVVLGVNGASNCPSGYTYVPYSLGSGSNDWTYMTLNDNSSAMGGLDSWGQYAENYNDMQWRSGHNTNWCFKYYPSTGGRPYLTVHELNFANCANGELTVPAASVAGNNQSGYVQRTGYGFYVGNMYDWASVNGNNDGWWRDSFSYNSPLSRLCLHMENAVWP